ncbi:conserved hypothetical protein [Candidatus Sulfotelmatomonas gaucii]|uniref:Uncharacterized protein n=1 Tax=Candidatus Sulfuritelmatomonas gaucii TaxID=2043161 RepID=A0A2N9L4N1_9BACT|nr:conserved hypothetical protein [Candidatus Sulfotelmatomonas gaucii]
MQGATPTLNEKLPMRLMKVLIKLAITAVVALAPLAYLSWWSSALVVDPLSVSVALKNGEFSSPFFTTYANDDYQVELYFLPPARPPATLDWKVVNRQGAVIASGQYDDRGGGNGAILGYYRPAWGTRQRVVLDIHSASGQKPVDTTLHVGMPERFEDASFAVVPLDAWAVIVAVVGLIWIVVSLRSRGGDASDSGS